MNCPICNKPISDHQQDFINDQLTEERAECRDQHHYYYYLFFGGITKEVIGPATLNGDPKDTEQRKELLHYQREILVALEQGHYIQLQEKRKLQ